MAYALIGSGVAAGSSDHNTVTTGGYTLATAPSIFFVAVVNDKGVSAPVPTDSVGGNTYTSKVTRTGTFNILTIYECLAPAYSSGMTWSLSLTNSYAAICVLAFSGSKTSSPYDQSTSATSAGATTIKPGSITASEDNCVYITALGIDVAEGSTPTIDASFVSPAPLFSNYTIGQHYGLAMSYRIQTTAAATDPTWTVATSISLTADMGTWKAAAVTGGLFGRSSLNGLSTSGPKQFTRVS